MKKILLAVLLFPVLKNFSQTSGNQAANYVRFDLGYEHNQFMPHNGWDTRSLAIELELPYKNPTFSRNYRFSFGNTNDGYFYAHIPVGPVIGILASLIDVKNCNCNGFSQDSKFFLVPDGFAVWPVQSKQFRFGVYANFLAFDVASRGSKNVDYAPDAGIKMHLFAGDKTFLFLRASGKYSTVFAGWGLQVTAGLGWDFSSKNNNSSGN